MKMNKTLVVDYRLYKESQDLLIKLGYSLIKLTRNAGFDLPISSHPDIFVAKFSDKIFVDNSVNKLFTKFRDVEILSREAGTNTEIKYPHDVAFNCVQVGKHLICKKNCTHKKILEFAQEKGLKIIDVNQGYAKCSTCVVSENAIITEDESIAQGCAANGIDVLKINKGHIKLDGYNYGFIGGCSGLIENNLLAFNGNLNKHPNCNEILNFCKSNKVNALSLADDLLYDIGSIIRI